MRSTPSSSITLLAAALASALAVGCSPSRQPPAKEAATSESPETYLVSVTFPLAGDQRLAAFALDTWGVDFMAVCHIPAGWRITAGRRASPDGVIVGEGSHGATWLGPDDLKALNALVLIGLNGPVQAQDQGVVPATFRGAAGIETPDDDERLEVPLTAANVRLTPATRCP